MQRYRQLSACLNVVLGKNVCTDIAAALSLAGDASDPFESPIGCVVVTVVLNVIPDAVCDLEELVAHFFGIVDAVIFAAKLEPPEVGQACSESVGA